MERFNKILVAVDLSRSSALPVSSLDTTALAIMDTAITLAHASDAELLVFTVLDGADEALPPLESLVEYARSHGVRAESKLVLGKPWFEIIRQAVQGQHDLVVVGPQDSSGLHLFFNGNTDLKLLRQCPCPVLVCKADMNNHQPNILVATDLGPASESALHYGIMLGCLLGAKVHLLHVATFPNDPLGNGHLGEVDAATKHHHKNVLAAVEKALREQLESTTYRDLGENCQVHLAEDVGDPAHRIEQFIATENIDLLVLGTAARHGLSGFIVGNTAERMMPEVHCSLLVAKGPDFRCPVHVTGQ